VEKETGFVMIVITGDNIISALGFTSADNYLKVKAGETGIRFYGDRFDIPDAFMASMIPVELLNEQFSLTCNANPGSYTTLEKAAILSVSKALENTGLDPSDPRLLFILSSTKGNIELLDGNVSGNYPPDRIHLWRTAQLISGYFHNPNTPLVVSNACISGAYALFTAKRALDSGPYTSVAVVGADVLSKFIVSGFQSFKALSATLCRPFDGRRSGLNLGEAAATMILSKREKEDVTLPGIVLTGGAACNDANHISGPSRTGEGLYLALRRVMQEKRPEELAFINAHGTATMYNDDMESIALTRCGLNAVPITGLKGCFGHTLGAAGVVESIISCMALRDGIILKTQGYGQSGTVCPLDIVQENRMTQKRYFIKMLSGFGGSNAALLFQKMEA
jgi:3-oxoacyl-[acyl-carrier-protein] synthase-1